MPKVVHTVMEWRALRSTHQAAGRIIGFVPTMGALHRGHASLIQAARQECDVVLTGSRKVSRKHCCIAQIDDHFVVRDLGSLNGLRLNGAQVEREALLQAAKSKTVAIGCAAGLVGVIIGVYVGRDITMRLLTDFLNER